MDADVDSALKKGTAELLVLAQLENGARHGYEIGQLITLRAGGAVSFQPASLYPVLYRLERRGLIAGRWVEKANQRRRRYYRLTSAGRRVLAEQLGELGVGAESVDHGPIETIACVPRSRTLAMNSAALSTTGPSFLAGSLR